MVGMNLWRRGLWPKASRGIAAAIWGGRGSRLGNQEIGYWTTVSRVEKGEESF